MLDSKAFGSVIPGANKEFLLYIRTDYQENLRTWAFRRHLKAFPTELAASLYFMKTYPMGRLVPFDQLTVG